MPQASHACAENQGHRIQVNRKPAQVYSVRGYESKLIADGRKILTIDLPAETLGKIDNLRGKKRRGIIVEELLAIALTHYANPEPKML